MQKTFVQHREIVQQTPNITRNKCGNEKNFDTIGDYSCNDICTVTCIRHPLTSFSLWFRIPRTRSCKFLSRTRSSVPLTLLSAILLAEAMNYLITVVSCINTSHIWNNFCRHFSVMITGNPTWLPPLIMWHVDVLSVRLR